ncbi:MAG: glyoxalase/bleomycin resistance protein/dioxygenase [Lacrimispora sp.]|nr:glyoxalase/bleomycin resistance protein/dioxygenase [Lacrimispora sp.]
MKCNLNSLYLCVQDMKRAIKFYEVFLERPVTVRDEIYSVFDINGFRLGLFAYKKMGEYHTFGNNCLPSLEVADKDILERKLNGMQVVFPVTKIEKNWVCEFKDSEGNYMEMTAPVCSFLIAGGVGVNILKKIRNLFLCFKQFFRKRL